MLFCFGRMRITVFYLSFERCDSNLLLLPVENFTNALLCSKKEPKEPNKDPRMIEKPGKDDNADT